MSVVSNTSPIINLAAIGELELLKKLYRKISIPPAVYNEITVKGKGEPGDKEVRAVEWIEVIEVTDIPLLTFLKMELDEGEAEAIALSIETSSTLLLLDERLGRKTASKYNLRCIGVLGILVEAKKKGFISSVKPKMDRLRTQAGFWVSEDLYRYVLDTAGESYP